MKKLFGKILVGAIGCAMALGINAYAANEIKDIKIDANKETLEVTITGTIDGDAASPESTILVAPENVSLLEVTDANIKYIDQETVQSGEFKYTFKLAEAGKYNVWFGGTDVVKPGEDVIDLTAEVAGTFKIVGKVTLSVEGDSVDVTKVTATAADKTASVDKETNQFALEVAPGTYEVVVGRAGYLYRTFSGVEVVDKDVEVADTVLMAGNIVNTEGEEAIINLLDLQALLDAYRAEAGSDDYVADADLNDDEIINLLDLQALLDNYRSTAEAYEAE